MAFIPTGSRAASLGSAFGTGIAKPIEQGLDFLMQNKMQSVLDKTKRYQSEQERNRIAETLSPILGPKTSQFLASQSPENQKYLFQNFGALSGLESILGGEQSGDQQDRMSSGMPQNDQKAQLIKDLFTSPAQKRSERDLEIKEENLALKKQNQQYQHQQSVKPFLDSEVADYKAQSQASKIAKEMKANILKNKKYWPGPITGNLPAEAQKILQRNPHVRKYSADANKLVQAIASTRKGTVTNYKLILEALSKADLGQPIETQIALLDEVINDYDESSKRQKYIHSLKDKHGNYPLDLAQKSVEFDLAVKSPLDYPQYYQDGTEYTDDDGIQYVLVGNEWKEV